MTQITSPKDIVASLEKYWAPVVVDENDNCVIKVCKTKGELGWHSHDGEDKFFQILKGTLTIEMEKETVTLHEGQMCVIKSGVRNNPKSAEECHIMFIEPK